MKSPSCHLNKKLQLLRMRPKVENPGLRLIDGNPEKNRKLNVIIIYAAYFIRVIPRISRATSNKKKEKKEKQKEKGENEPRLFGIFATLFPPLCAFAHCFR